MSRRRLLLAGGLVVLVLAAAAVYWFEPQALFLDDEVDEAVPVAADGTADGADGADGGAPPPPRTLLAGRVGGVDGHDMEGRAVVLDVGGTRYLRFEDLRGDNGPDLVVYLSAAPADGDPDALDDDVVDLGGLKGNVGSSNYELPAGVDLDRYATAVVWCRRFSVGFAAAELRPPASA